MRFTSVLYAPCNFLTDYGSVRRAGSRGILPRRYEMVVVLLGTVSLVGLSHFEVEQRGFRVRGLLVRARSPFRPLVSGMLSLVDEIRRGVVRGYSYFSVVGHTGRPSRLVAVPHEGGSYKVIRHVSGFF